MRDIIDTEPSFHGDTTSHEVWKDAMTEEYQFIMKKYMSNIVLRLKGKSVVNSKCIYNIKLIADGSVEKYKEIFVAKGFSQVEGIHYEENFSPLDRYTSICMIISLAISMGWRLHEMDLKTNFFNGEIDEEF
jgi:hypothetical protein